MVRTASLLLSLNNHKFLFTVAINGESRANMSCYIPSGTHIVFFVGELMTDPAEIIRRSAQSERGGYLDCFESSSRGHCLASMSNYPYECYNTHSDRPAFDHARFTYKAWGNGHYYQWGLVSKKTIPAHEEILWNYGAAYIYPTSD